MKRKVFHKLINSDCDSVLEYMEIEILKTITVCYSYDYSIVEKVYLNILSFDKTIKILEIATTSGLDPVCMSKGLLNIKYGKQPSKIYMFKYKIMKALKSLFYVKLMDKIKNWQWQFFIICGFLGMFCVLSGIISGLIFLLFYLNLI